MASERTACDRLVGRLVSYGEPEGVWSRLRIGMFLLRRVYEGLLSGAAARALPVDGVKKGLVAHGQAGAVLPAFVFSFWVPVSWVARDARELVYASIGCEAGGDGKDGISGRG